MNLHSDQPFPAATITAYQVGAVIGRRVAFNYQPMRETVRWFTLLDAYLISRPDEVEDGFDPDKVVVIFCDEDGDGPEQGMELNPVSDVLVELSTDEWAERRHFPCGPYLSRTSWEPDLIRLRRGSPEPEPEPPTVESDAGPQFALF